MQMLDTLIAEMSKDLEQNGPNPYVLKERGRLKMLQGDHEGAMADLRLAVQLKPEIMKEISGVFEK